MERVWELGSAIKEALGSWQINAVQGKDQGVKTRRCRIRGFISLLSMAFDGTFWEASERFYFLARGHFPPISVRTLELHLGLLPICRTGASKMMGPVQPSPSGRYPEPGTSPPPPPTLPRATNDLLCP